MANLGNTIVNGILRVNGKINASDVISAPSFTGALTGNAATATKLAIARTINGVSFDGSANITVADSTKLPLAGGTITGNISYNMNGSTQIPFKVYGGDANGQNVSVGAGGATIVGSGESAKNCESLLGATSENLWLASDNDIAFITNCQTIGNRVSVNLSASREFYPNVNNTGTLGKSNYKWNNVYATTFTGNLSGNANSATNAKNTGTTNTNPTSGTWYYPTWVTGTSGNLPHRVNNGYQYYTLEGTTSAAGRAILQLGNATATGTAGNKYGEVRIYNQNKGYTTILGTSSASNFTITLPAASGTVSLTSHTHSAATTSANGFMSSADKTKLNALHYVRSGTKVPDKSLGENGDIYILLES